MLAAVGAWAFYSNRVADKAAAAGGAAIGLSAAAPASGASGAGGAGCIAAGAILLALVSGIFQVAFGMMRMGVLLNFLSLRGSFGSYDDAVFGRGSIEDFTWKGNLDLLTCT